MKQYNRILFVAENGTCRAPMAAGILGEYVLKHPVEIGARGMVVLFPEPLNQKAEAVMISNGINLQAYGLCYETMRKTIKKLVTLLNEESNEGSEEN